MTKILETYCNKCGKKITRLERYMITINSMEPHKLMDQVDFCKKCFNELLNIYHEWMSENCQNPENIKYIKKINKIVKNAFAQSSDTNSTQNFSLQKKCEDGNKLRRPIPELIPLSKFNEFFEYPSVKALRQYRFYGNRNGFNNVLKYIGKRIYIDVKAYEKWINNNSKTVRG